MSVGQGELRASCPTTCFPLPGTSRVCTALLVRRILTEIRHSDGAAAGLQRQWQRLWRGGELGRGRTSSGWLFGSRHRLLAALRGRCPFWNAQGPSVPARAHLCLCELGTFRAAGELPFLAPSLAVTLSSQKSLGVTLVRKWLRGVESVYLLRKRPWQGS